MPDDTLSSLPEILPPVLAITALLAVSCLLLWIVLHHLRIRWQFAHTERMKALEVGSPIRALNPPQEPMQHLHNTFRMAFCLGAVLPVAAIWAAVWATSIQGSLGYSLVVWICVAVVSTAGVVCGTVVLLRSRPHSTDCAATTADNSSSATTQPRQEAEPQRQGMA
ncbi:MAG: hypothetical protein GXY83_14635 [Rhodopirellula sp.]|nr:hypothetical protein [Rhodopirellula sp.]